MGDGEAGGSKARTRVVLASSATVECASALASADDTAAGSCWDDSMAASSAASSIRD